MNLQRREEIRAIAKEFRRLLLREQAQAIDELLAYVDTLEQAAAERVIADGSRGPGVVPAVVMPDDDRPSREFLENYVEGFDPGERSAALFGWREGRRHLRENSRTVPADRVLEEGMVAVRREEWERLQKFERDTKETDSRDCSDCAHYRRSQSCPGCTHPESPQNEYAFDWLLAQRCEFYALRANQGGANE